MAKTTHTHRGTCQACGSVQAVDNGSKLLAKHGYKVAYGHFQFVCNAAGYQPAEHDLTYTHETIANCLKSATWHDGQVPKLKSGEVVPETFERWNPNKVKVNRRRHGGTYETKGDYDTLPIAQANAEERAARINGQICHHERQAEGLRSHVAFLRSHVVPRLGKPLYPNEELTKAALGVGTTFSYNGVEHVITRPAYSQWGQDRLVGWYVKRTGATTDLRWTSKQIRDAMNPKPVVAAGGYATKAARKADLDKLNRKYSAEVDKLQALYLALPRDQRTEAKTEVYYAPHDLHQWRDRHSKAALHEFPEAKNIVANIETLVAERARVKAAP